MTIGIGVDTESVEAFTAAHDRAELDRAEREAKYKVDHTRPNWRAFKTKNETQDELTKENIKRI